MTSLLLVLRGQALVIRWSICSCLTTGTLPWTKLHTSRCAALTPNTGGSSTNATFPTVLLLVADLGSTQNLPEQRHSTIVTIADTNIPSPEEITL